MRGARGLGRVRCSQVEVNSMSLHIWTNDPNVIHIRSTVQECCGTFMDHLLQGCQPRNKLIIAFMLFTGWSCPSWHLCLWYAA